MQVIHKSVIRVSVGLEAMVKELETSKLKIKGLKGELVKYSQGSCLRARLYLVGITLEARVMGEDYRQAVFFLMSGNSILLKRAIKAGWVFSRSQSPPSDNGNSIVEHA